jgi:membrane protein YdbS with pleckstrin-like domain
MKPPPLPEAIFALERPHPNLWKLYVIREICTGPAAIILLPYLYFRYHTLRYRFDAEGIHMKVGILFRREVNVTYARIQDIHLSSGLIQRWLGLADVQIQTASGNAGAELTVEGFMEYEAIRDFLYAKITPPHRRRGAARMRRGRPMRRSHCSWPFGMNSGPPGKLSRRIHPFRRSHDGCLSALVRDHPAHSP